MLTHTGWQHSCASRCEFFKKEASEQCSEPKASRSSERSCGKRLTGMQFAVMQVLHDGGELPG